MNGSNHTLAPDRAFRQFQYPTVPLHVSDDYMNTALMKALSPALTPADDIGKD